ncbi:hypothetical protein WJX73_000735 [Symbiochloris irregularis]|uniref:Transcription initiation factor TFIID subunit 2 n=1 Tax=Symbiochloris irregularis TaxID=706552 RepID=A0AAW1NJU2_9CHLO
MGIAVGPFAKASLLAKSKAAQAPAPPSAGPKNNVASHPQTAAKGTVITTFVPPSHANLLQSASDSCLSAFTHYEGILGEGFPLPFLQLAFLPEGLAPVGGLQLACGLLLMSEEALQEPLAVEQAMHAHTALAGALARLWMGVALRPKVPSDEWVARGLAAWLLDGYIRKTFGLNELLYRRWQQRELMLSLDDGSAPPLVYRHRAEGPWGPLHSIDALSPAPLLPWKAAAVVGMLEKRIGDDGFRRVVERMVTEACHTLAGTPRAEGAKPEDGADAGRQLTTKELLKAVGKEGGLRREMPAFHDRWVTGRGCASITAAYDAVNPVKRRSNDKVLELAVKLQADSQVRHSMARTLASLGNLKATVHEDAEASIEHAITLPAPTGPVTHTLVELKMPARQPGKRKDQKPKGRRKNAAGDGEEAAEEGGEEAAEEAAGGSLANVLWVTVDLHTALAHVKVLQPERVWLAILEHARDVPSQLAAIRFIRGIAPSRMSPAAVAALHRCLINSNNFCRVQLEAAHALCAVAKVRDQRGKSPVAATHFISGVLQQSGEALSGGQLYDGRGTTAAFAAAAGALQPQSSQAMAEVCACTMLEAETAPQIKGEILEDAMYLLATSAPPPAQTPSSEPMGRTEKLLPKRPTPIATPSYATLRKLHALLEEVGEPHVRHRAFMLLRRLGALPPTLFRVQVEDEPSSGGATVSAETNFTRAPGAQTAKGTRVRPTATAVLSLSQDAPTPPQEPGSIAKPGKPRDRRISFGNEPSAVKSSPVPSELPQPSASEVHNAPAGDEVRSPFRPPPAPSYHAHVQSPAPAAPTAAAHSRPPDVGPVKIGGEKKRKRPATPTPLAEGGEIAAKPKKERPAKAKTPPVTPDPKLLTDVAAIMASQAPQPPKKKQRQPTPPLQHVPASQPQPQQQQRQGTPVSTSPHGPVTKKPRTEARGPSPKRPTPPPLQLPLTHQPRSGAGLAAYGASGLDAGVSQPQPLRPPSGSGSLKQFFWLPGV